MFTKVEVKLNQWGYGWTIGYNGTKPNIETIYPYFQRVQAYTRAPAVVEAYRGGSFSLFDGEISGEFIDLVRWFMHECHLVDHTISATRHQAGSEMEEEEVA